MISNTAHHRLRILMRNTAPIDFAPPVYLISNVFIRQTDCRLTHALSRRGNFRRTGSARSGTTRTRT